MSRVDIQPYYYTEVVMASPALVRGNHSRAFLTLLLLLALIGGELCLAGYTFGLRLGLGRPLGLGRTGRFLRHELSRVSWPRPFKIATAWALFCQSGSGR